MPESSRIVRAVSIPITIRPPPRISPNARIVCIIPLIRSRLFCPIRFASTAFGPTESPTIRFTNIPTSATQLPTAASALSPANLPTTATSAELNSCCMILLKATGSAKIIRFPAMPPFIISISLFLIFCFMFYSSPFHTAYYILSSEELNGNRNLAPERMKTEKPANIDPERMKL